LRKYTILFPPSKTFGHYKTTPFSCKGVVFAYIFIFSLEALAIIGCEQNTIFIARIKQAQFLYYQGKYDKVIYLLSALVQTKLCRGIIDF